MAQIRTQNTKELAVAELMEANGLEVLKAGWPDFAIVDWEKERVSFCEVKPYGEKLKPRQEKMRKVFELAGIKYNTLWVTDEGKVYNPEKLHHKAKLLS